ncbi:UvrD-helicase domain-containing protein, partial [bacterium]|nr:UvrD-helicase domain-containing protein [bacterium]
MAIDFRNELNPQQQAGVFATEGAVLVLAGAGSGKTRMLTYKIAYLIEEGGIAPHSILAVTFTNKAANEMRERIKFLLNSSISVKWLGTFHSICGKILRIDGDKIGIPSDYLIYDAEDSRNLVREIIIDLGHDIKTIAPKKVANAISRLKRKLISPDEFSNAAKNTAEKLVSDIYRRYDELLRRAKAVDFDDMISLVVKLLGTNEAVMKKYSEKFQYILVDEFQDTNESQFAFLRHLTAVHKNITVVGDDDQSIYSWRGAQVKNILEFPKIFPDCKIIKLEKNYRSTGHILSAASGVIANNRMRHPKKLFTDAGSGEKVSVVRLPDERAEARYVVDRIESLLAQDILPGDIAILYRINALSRIFEEELRRRNIPYVVVGGTGFYERKEIKDILAYLRLIVNFDDDISFRRIVNRPRRGIGITTVEKIVELASQAETSIMELLGAKIPLPVHKRARTKLENFYNMISEFHADADSAKPTVIIQEILERSGYLRMLEEDGSMDAQTRLENIGQLLDAALEFESENPEPTLRNFIASITLMTDVDRWSHSSDTVNLMTVHAAKGLEFDAVFIA